MDRISELLDEVGFQPKDDMNVYTTKVFTWMTEATNRIQELEWKVKTLVEVCEKQQQLIDRQVKVLETVGNSVARGFENIADGLEDLTK